MIKSRYLEAFKYLAEKGKEVVELRADTILVETIDLGEAKTKSGIIVQSSNQNHDGFGQNRPTLAFVLLVGKGYFDEATGEDVPLEVQPGDIVMVPGTALKRFSQFGPIMGTMAVAMTNDSSIQMIFKGEDGYNKISDILAEVLTPEEN